MNLAKLPEWYEPHVAAWARAATPRTLLWFWNTEVGWATVHPVLARHGWHYEQACVWDKGLRHAAGRVNSHTIRHFPVVTELCVMYSRPVELASGDKMLPLQQWMRAEWLRTGLPLRLANQACGVKNAATRKYLTADNLWYPPPGTALVAMAKYANQHGRPEGRPYFELACDERGVAAGWDEQRLQHRWEHTLRYRWHHVHGISNVWDCPPVSGPERLRGRGLRAAAGRQNLGADNSTHFNQKPLMLMRRILQACTDPGDVIWEPFGGLCTASVAAVQLGRAAYAAELVPSFAEAARERLQMASTNLFA
jgi:site-specific DNA-methyltransferase (adenine-specific)